MTMIINNTGSDIRPFDKQLLEIAKTHQIPEEFADLFSFTFIVIRDEERMIIDFA